MFKNAFAKFETDFEFHIRSQRKINNRETLKSSIRKYILSGFYTCFSTSVI